MANTSVGQKPSLFGMISSPIQQIGRIKNQPIFWGALISFCLFTSILFGINGYYAVNDPAYTNTIPQEIRTQENVATIKLTSLSFMIFSGLLGSLLIPVFGGLALWIFSRLLRGEGTLRQFFSFQVHLFSIYLLAFLVQALLTVVMGKQLMVSPLSLAIVLPVDGRVEQILSNLDLFTFWIAILLRYGMKEIAHFSSVKSWLIAVLYVVFIIVLSFF